MRRDIRVYFGDAPRAVGVLRFDKQGNRESAMFEYTAEWLADSERFALEPALALVGGPQFHKRVKDGSVFHSIMADEKVWRMGEAGHSDAFEHSEREAAPKLR